MQGQRNSVESFPEAFEFEHGANSSNSSMDPQSLWDTMMLNPVQTQSMPEFVLSTGEAGMAFMNADNDDTSQSTWRLGSASSSQNQLSHDSLVENKLDHGWRTPLRINAGGGPMVDERHFETSSMLSRGNVNINLNSSFIDQNSSLSAMHQNLEYAADRAGTGKEASESSQLHPYSSGHFSSSIGFSSHCASSLADVGPVPEDDGRTGSLLDGRRLACKRKNIEGFPGQSPSNEIASSSQHGENILQHSTCHNYIPLTSSDISGSSVHQPVPSSPEEYQQSFGTIARGMASDCYPSASTAGSTESSHRNYRTRMNPTQQHDIYPPSLWSTSAIRRSHQWQLNQPSAVPFNHSLEPVFGHGSSYAQNQHHIPASSFSQTTYHLPWTGTYPRIGSSSSSFNIDEDMVDTRVEHNPGNFPVTSNLDFVPTVETQQMAQDPVNWNLGTRDISVNSISRAGSSPAIYPTLGSPWVPYQSHATQYPRSLSEAVRQSPFASASSESASQGMNYPMQHATHSYDSRELIQLRASLRGLQPAPHVRSTYTMERQSDAFPGAPLNTRTSTIREGRQRMISEIRLALESMRSANDLSFEDMFMFDRSVILAGAGDLHDRHRDMRLDVDNMSYEELLALGERIGDVNTGLTEETVSKRLKQRKYFMGSDELMDEEPCCICQEEYVRGEDLGILDCGHDFHTLCIKQWLLQKNLCPICKNTALVP